MKTKLFTEPGTCYQFTSLARALIWCADNKIESFIAITYYPNQEKVSVFNPFLEGLKLGIFLNLRPGCFKMKTLFKTITTAIAIYYLYQTGVHLNEANNTRVEIESKIAQFNQLNKGN